MSIRTWRTPLPSKRSYTPTSRRARSFAAALPLLAAACLLNTPSQAQTDFTWAPLKEPGVGGQVTSLSVSPFDSNRVLAAGDLLGIALSTNGGSTWKSTFGLTGGGLTVEQFTWVNSTTVWVATARGPYVSTDGGTVWNNRRSGFPSFVGLGFTAPIQKILIDPNNSSRLLAFTGNFRRFNSSNGYTNLGEVWESTNGGSNWSLKSTIVAGKHVEHAVYKDNNTIYAICDGKFWRSSNDGSSWSQQGTGLTGNAKWVTRSPTNGATVWVVTTNGVFKSTNSGTNFSSSSSGIPSGSEFRVVEVDQENDGRDVLYATVTVNDPDRGVWRSTNGGSSWTRTNYSGAPGLSGYPDQAYANTKPKVLTIDPSDSDRVFMGNNEAIYRSNNTGNDWSIVSNTALGSGFYVGTGFSGLVCEDFIFNPFNPNESATCALDSGKWFSRDDLQTWKFAAGGEGRGVNTFFGCQDVAFTNTSGGSQVIYLAQGQFGGQQPALYRTTDGGNNWSARTLPSGTSGDIQDVYAHPTNTNTVWLVRSSKLYRSTNGGSSWTQLTSGISGTIRAIAADPTVAGNTIYAGSSNGVYKTTDGINFTELGFPQDGVTEVTIDPVKSDRIYVVNRKDSTSSQRGVYRYDGDTDTWTTIVLNGTIKLINDVAIDPLDNTRVFVSTDEDPFKSSTGETGVWVKEGSSPFVQVSRALPILKVQSLTFKPGTSKLIASTNGRGYFVAETGGGGGGGSGLDVSVGGSNQTLASSSFSSYASGQDLSGGFTIEDGGATIKLTGNSWKKAPLSYTITANTVLKFDFRSTDEGEIHAIALDDNNDFQDVKKAFQVHGSQTWTSDGITDFNNYSGSSFTSYTIPVGTYYTGAVNNIAFINDGDSNTGIGFFRNVEIFESGGGGGTILAENFNSTSLGSIPSGWTRDTGGGSVGVVDFPSSSDRSLRVADTKNFDSSSASVDFTATSGVVTVSFRWRQSDQDNWTRMQVRSGSTVVADLRTRSGNIAIEGSSSSTNIFNYASNTWYDIEIELDTGSDTFDVRINGALEASNQPFKNAASSVNRFRTNTGTGAVTNVWIDDLLVSD